MQDIAQKQIFFLKTTRAGSGSGFGGEISGSGKKVRIRIRNTGIVDPKLFIPDPDLDPTSESIRIRILDCASY